MEKEPRCVACPIGTQTTELSDEEKQKPVSVDVPEYGDALPPKKYVLDLVKKNPFADGELGA